MLICQKETFKNMLVAETKTFSAGGSAYMEITRNIFNDEPKITVVYYYRVDDGSECGYHYDMKVKKVESSFLNWNDDKILEKQGLRLFDIYI